MRKNKYCLIAVCMFFLSIIIINNAYATDYYLSPTGSNSNDGLSYKTPWHSLDYALNKGANDGTHSRVGPGDTLYLLGGVYNIPSMSMVDSEAPHMRLSPTTPESARTVIKSYPGEWAILDGGNSNPVLMTNTVPTMHNVTFENMEVRNGFNWGFNFKDDGAWEPVMLSGAIFRNIYFHDNGNPDNPDINTSGLMLTCADCLIEYCTFEDNGTPGSDNHNSANLTIIQQYLKTVGEIANYPRKNNIIRYNVFEGSAVGIKEKGPGNFVDSSTGEITTTHPEWANDVHHNVFSSNLRNGYYCSTDFAKVHHNLFVNCVNEFAFRTNSNENPPNTQYQVQVYNNTFVNSGLSEIKIVTYTTTPHIGYEHNIYNNLMTEYTRGMYLFVGQTYEWDITSDYNFFDTGTYVARMFKFEDKTFAQMQTAGYETHSIQEAISLNVDYTLPAGSSAIGGGLNGADIGAFPYGEKNWYNDAGYYGLQTIAIRLTIDAIEVK